MATTCPNCHQPTQKETAPFCSDRCKEVDLGKWLTGAYAIPGRDGEAYIPDEVDEG